MLKELFISMRPKQWYKNLVVFIGIVFSKNLFNLNLLFIVVLSFSVFCALSSAQYIINDILDREKDKKHPRKSKRPIASGAINPTTAAGFAVLLTAGALSVSIYIGRLFALIAVGYLILALYYSVSLKNFKIVDIVVISFFFVIRAWAGSIAVNAPISEWLIICTFLLAMFLAVSKRRHELAILGDKIAGHRKSLGQYSKHMLDQMLTIITSVLLMSYCLYTFIPSAAPIGANTSTRYMMLTIPFAFYGIFRYLFLVHRRNIGGEAEMIFNDIPMLVNIFLWAATVVFVMYGSPEKLLSLFC